MYEVKTVRDPVHGDIHIDDHINSLIAAPEIQRLYNIKQLGFAHLVFPGAHHTRLEHCLGAYHIADRIATTLHLPKQEHDIITIAALLHDIGHGPFSHTLETNLRQKFNVDHVDLTEQLILGDYAVLDAEEQPFIESKTVHELLTERDAPLKEIVNCIRGKESTPPYLQQLLHSTIDVDQLDFLIRDSYYTGVAYGLIDLNRLIQTLSIHNEQITIKRKGVSAIENILMARGLMYTSVYFHKTVRIAELMLSRAIETIDQTHPFRFFTMTDGELLNALLNIGSYQKEIAIRLKYRRLYKQAFALADDDLTEEQHHLLHTLEDPQKRHEKEQEFEDTFSIPPGRIIIDLPVTELHQAEPRIHRTDIEVLTNNQLKPFHTFTPIAHALQSRHTPDWTVMIITDEPFRDRVAEKGPALLFK